MEETSSESVQHVLQLDVRINRTVQPHNADILFTRSLLRFCQSGRTFEANYEAASDLGIKSTGMTGFLDVEDLLDP